ncbi:MAG TPA: hypothetical protein VF678_02160 [bacterium]
MAKRAVDAAVSALLGFAAIAVMGCASTGRVTLEQANNTKALGGNVEAVNLTPMRLNMLSYTKKDMGVVVLAAAFGAAMSIDAGPDLQKGFNLQDPMTLAMSGILRGFKEKYQLEIPVQTAADATNGPRKRYQLRFQTLEWGMNTYYGEDTPLGFSYSGVVALVDTAGMPEQELWRVMCASAETSDPPKVTLAALKADNAALLKQRIADQAAMCAKALFADAPVTKN